MFNFFNELIKFLGTLSTDKKTPILSTEIHNDSQNPGSPAGIEAANSWDRNIARESPSQSEHKNCMISDAWASQGKHAFLKDL